MIKRKYLHLCCVAALVALTACSNQEESSEPHNSFGTIQVGGLSMNNNIGTIATRSNETNDSNVLDPATDKSLEWLKTALETGIEITYSNKFDEFGSITNGTAKTALLKYVNQNYTFTYVSNDGTNAKPAEWMSNGYHVFEGYYIPEKLKNGNVAYDYIEDQSNINNKSYDLLSQYTCMPIFPQSKIAATVNQISLPFQHRLARVIVQIVIDKDIKKDYNDPKSPTASILGYNKETGGGKDCTLRFCGVKVLNNVVDNKPTWIDDPELKVVPHFIEEREKITVTTYDEENKPTETTYENVPTFDLIVQPTYFEQSAPMSDEKTGNTDSDKDIMEKSNSISFTVSLDNGMVYNKDVEFDLNPNEQTTITLLINKEGVNVNDAGTNNWITDTFRQDDYYGIDNTLGHNLSKAGSCWQRAYQISNDNYGVTDGSNPKDPENADGKNNTQYLTKDQFIAYLKDAKEGGAHHGDYFILTGDLTLPNDWKAFEFTGHLDGRHHNITLPDESTALFSALKGDYDKPSYKVNGETITANIHTDVNGNTYPKLGYRAEILNLYLTNQDANLVSGQNTGYIYNCHIIGSGNFCAENAEGNTLGQVVDCTKK